MSQTKGGGQPIVRPMPYSPPVGPKGINDSKGGTNHGNCGTQGK